MQVFLFFLDFTKAILINQIELPNNRWCIYNLESFITLNVNKNTTN